MSTNKFQYCIVEHIWRACRAIFILIGTSLWLFTAVHPLIIFSCYFCAALVDQLHGVICHKIEKALKYEEQHDDWE